MVYTFIICSASNITILISLRYSSGINNPPQEGCYLIRDVGRDVRRDVGRYRLRHQRRERSKVRSSGRGRGRACLTRGALSGRLGFLSLAHGEQTPPHLAVMSTFHEESARRANLVRTRDVGYILQAPQSGLTKTQDEHITIPHCISLAQLTSITYLDSI